MHLQRHLAATRLTTHLSLNVTPEGAATFNEDYTDYVDKIYKPWQKYCGKSVMRKFAFSTHGSEKAKIIQVNISTAYDKVFTTNKAGLYLLPEFDESEDNMLAYRSKCKLFIEASFGMPFFHKIINCTDCE